MILRWGEPLVGCACLGPRLTGGFRASLLCAHHVSVHVADRPAISRGVAAGSYLDGSSSCGSGGVGAPGWLGAELGVPARTVSRVLACRQVPSLSMLDPLTGAGIRSSRASAVRYERDRPGELVHMDVNKIGRIPGGGGWRAHGRTQQETTRDRTTKVGFDDVHSLADEHSRPACSAILPDDKGATCPAFLRPSRHPRIERLMTGNAWAYRWSLRQTAPSTASARGSSNPTAPGKTAKSSATTAPCTPSGPTGRVFTSNTQRATALAPWLKHYNTQHRRGALGSHPSPADCHQPDGQVHLGRLLQVRLRPLECEDRALLAARLRPAALLLDLAGLHELADHLARVRVLLAQTTTPQLRGALRLGEPK